MPYGPFSTWTDACRTFYAVVRCMEGAQPLMEIASRWLGVHRGVDLVDQFGARGVITSAGGDFANPLFRYTGQPFGSPAVDAEVL